MYLRNMRDATTVTQNIKYNENDVNWHRHNLHVICSIQSSTWLWVQKKHGLMCAVVLEGVWPNSDVNVDKTDAVCVPTVGRAQETQGKTPSCTSFGK